MASEFFAESLESMDRHLQKWEGDHKLRQRVRGGLQQIRKKSVYSFLKDLNQRGVIPEHFGAWHKTRNSVMHGELSEPWPNETSDKHLRELIALLHGLTHAHIAGAA